jgi:hypothetical protein
MRRLVIAIMLFTLGLTLATSASADWRWKRPNYHLGTLKVGCSSDRCYHDAKVRRRHRLEKRVHQYNKRMRKEWKLWTARYIPDCTWYGESGRGPEFARYRYTLPNSTGSGAYGKFQFMPHTYYVNGKYDDWSPLDQEIAVRREYWKHGEAPWSNC